MTPRARVQAAAIAAGIRAPAGTRRRFSLEDMGARLAGWWALELERGRAFLFLPVAMSAGILLISPLPMSPR